MKAALIILFAVLALACAQRGRPVDFVKNNPGSVDFVDNNPGSVDFVDNNPVDFVDNNPGFDVNFVNNNPGSFVIDPAFSRPIVQNRPSGGFQRPDNRPALVNNPTYGAVPYAYARGG